MGDVVDDVLTDSDGAELGVFDGPAEGATGAGDLRGIDEYGVFKRFHSG